MTAGQGLQPPFRWGAGLPELALGPCPHPALGASHVGRCGGWLGGRVVVLLDAENIPGVSCKDVPGGTSGAGLTNQVWVAAPPHPVRPTLHPIPSCTHIQGALFSGPLLAEDWFMPLTFKVLHVISWEAEKEEEKHPSGRAVA